MKVLKNDNGDIVKNSDGNLLYKTDDLINLRSTFGVDKTGSAVNYVQLFNSPGMIFRAPSGNEPIENGDGFEFNGTTTALLGDNPDFTLQTDDYLFGSMWIKKDAFSGTRKMLQIMNNTSDELEFLFDWQNGTNLRVLISTDGTVLNNVSSSYVISDTANWIDIWHNVGFALQRTSGTSWIVCLFIDGVMRGKTTLVFNPPKANAKLAVGYKETTQDQVFDGHIDDVKMKKLLEYDLTQYNNGDEVFTPLERSSA